MLRVIAIACLIAGLSGQSSPSGEAPPRPDILLIMPDQMRGDCLSVLGHPAVRTPTLDRLAREGVLFRRAYATVPSCIPARHALLTGLFPQTSGVVGFKARRISVPTLPQSLGAVGYTTVLVGRNMHQVPASESYGYGQRILGSTYVANDDYDRALREAAPDTGGIRQLVKRIGVTYNHWQAQPWPLDDELHPTAWIAAQGREVVANTPADEPLFLTASFYAPHPPLFPPKALFDSYMNAKLPAPARGDWVDWGKLKPKGDGTGHRVLLEGQTLRRAQAGYFGLIEQLDAAVAPLIEAFAARSKAAGRPWVVVVTSDHGEMLGDHGYFRKCEPFEGSANIPFLVTGAPELGFDAGSRSDRPVCLEDVMPTLLALAGAEIPEPMDGVDLGPALRGKRVPIRDWLHFEHAPCYGKAQAFHALTDGRFKYIWRTTDGTEHLFDLERDPREERDLSTVRSHRKTLAKWRATMVQRLAKRPEGFSDGKRLIAGRPYPPLQKQPK